MTGFMSGFVRGAAGAVVNHIEENKDQRQAMLEENTRRMNDRIDENRRQRREAVSSVENRMRTLSKLPHLQGASAATLAHMARSEKSMDAAMNSDFVVPLDVEGAKPFDPANLHQIATKAAGYGQENGAPAAPAQEKSFGGFLKQTFGKADPASVNNEAVSRAATTQGMTEGEARSSIAGAGASSVEGQLTHEVLTPDIIKQVGPAIVQKMEAGGAQSVSARDLHIAKLWYAKYSTDVAKASAIAGGKKASQLSAQTAQLLGRGNVPADQSINTGQTGEQAPAPQQPSAGVVSTANAAPVGPTIEEGRNAKEVVMGSIPEGAEVVKEIGTKSKKFTARFYRVNGQLVYVKVPVGR